jgi:hypothetical protein
MAIARKVSAREERAYVSESLEAARTDHRGNLMKMVSLRMPDELDRRIEECLKTHTGRISRNTFILEAISEKLKRDNPRPAGKRR